MKSIKCPECGFVGWADSDRCKKCGVIHLANPNSSSPPAPSTYLDREQFYQGYGSGELKKGMAVASLVLGIVGIFSFGVLGIGAIIGIVCAAKAMGRAKRLPAEYGGEGVATAGLVMNIFGLVLVVPLLAILAVAIPNVMASYRAANEGSSISSMRKIHAAEATYQATAGNGSYGTLDDLVKQSLVPAELATGVRNGYRFKIETTPQTETSSATFVAVGVPVTYGQTGVRSFFVNESGVIRVADNRGREATLADPPLGSESSFSSSSSRSRNRDPAYDY
ncbi:MAG TPA: DUF4190 domain-containing protein [Pyrinomonadaceae bacterium]|nr:DUF4190 domain-containing protein [Pyrinomonadaceae bacterium]